MRLFFCRILCLLKAQQRKTTIPAAEPVFVCGAFRNSCGIAQGARLYFQACQKAGRQTFAVDLTGPMRLKQELPATDIPRFIIPHTKNATCKGTVVIHANPPQFQFALCALGKDFLKNKRIVAYWAWELETLPMVWRHALAYLDAIEVPSCFVQAIIQRYTDKPVTVRPHLLPVPQVRKTAFAADGIIRCLSIFDAASSFERKNPLAVLRAFKQAFNPGEAQLTFKVTNVHRAPKQFAAFQAACKQVPGVRILTEIVSPSALEDLYLKHDVYLSLHRSEGFGLTIQEALLYGLHAVATGWSGNMDFMHGELAHAVPFSLVPVNMPHGPFARLKAQWAEANIDAAAQILRNVRQALLQGGEHA